MRIKCKNCEYEWDYKGKSRYFATCPRCLRKISLTNKKRTSTSSFGSSGRFGHDSSLFYNRKLYNDVEIEEEISEIENPLPSNVLDQILCQDSRKMDNIPDSSVHLMVTSPPYNVGKEYDEDLDLNAYLDLLRDVFSETYRVLVSGGRACVNIANIGRKPYIPYHKFIIDKMLEVGFLMRGEVIWNKSAGAGASTAWGSWCSATNPTLRDTHEYILIFSKGKFSRNGKDKESTISGDEFLQFTKSIWEFQPESAKKVGHPAPFPVELPYRCIQLYTFKGDVVLDPFCGVGTTAIAALETNRHFICLDNNPEYIEKAKRRIENFLIQEKLSKYIQKDNHKTETTETYYRKLRPAEAKHHFVFIEQKYRNMFPPPKNEFKVVINGEEYGVSMDKQGRIWLSAFYQYLPSFEEGDWISIANLSKDVFRIGLSKSPP